MNMFTHGAHDDAVCVCGGVYTFFCPVGSSAMARTVDDFWMVTPEGTDHGERTMRALEEASGPGVVVKRGARSRGASQSKRATP